MMIKDGHLFLSLMADGGSSPGRQLRVVPARGLESRSCVRSRAPRTPADYLPSATRDSTGKPMR